MNTANEQPKLFVIVLNYNGKDTLPACLASVYQSDYNNFEVVVVDNNSKDGSFEAAKNQFSRAHFIRSPQNIGFARGNNLGLRFALEKFADFVLLLNNDAFLQKNTLSILLEAAQEKKSPAIFNPLIVNKNDQKIWFAGGKIKWLQMKNVHLTKATAAKIYPTQYCTGCAMLVSKEIFKKIGLFDERYFLYYEDADFSVRALKAGFGLFICPSAKVSHAEQSCAKNKTKVYWLVLSGLLFFSTNGASPQRIWFFFYFLLRKFKNLYLIVFEPSLEATQVQQAFQAFKKLKSE